MIEIYLKFLFFLSLLFFLFFIYSLVKQKNCLAAPFSLLCLSISIYIGGYALELQANSLEHIMFAIKLEYFGSPFMSAFWLLLSYEFLFRKPASLQLTLLFMSIPFIILFLNVTNEFHHLIFSRIFTFRYDEYLLVRLSKGPGYYINIVYAYLVQMFGIVVFFRVWKTRGYQIRTQAFWMFWGSLWPVIFNIVYVAGYSPLELDLTPLGLGISGFFFFVSVSRYGFLELRDISKDITFLEIDEGIIVVDNKNRLIDFNQAGKEIFDWLNLNQIGIDIGTYPEGKKILGQTSDHFEMKLTNNKEERCYEFHRKPLIDQTTKLGSIYFIKNVSRQKQIARELNDITSYDSLTQIFNRCRLMEEMNKELVRLKRYGKCMSVLLIAIDHFREINDQYGPQTGDDILKALAASCRERIRKTDIIGRYDGEVFIIIFPELSEENSFQVADSIRKGIAGLDFLSNGKVIRIKVTIGLKTVYSFEKDLTAENIIRSVERKLQEEKGLSQK